jgi:hypothetical protein
MKARSRSGLEASLRVSREPSGLRSVLSEPSIAELNSLKRQKAGGFDAWACG